MDSIQQQLIDLGLSDSEVTVYLAMISGVLTARDLVKVTSLKRPTVYYALGCLEKRGLISKTGLTGDKKFAVEPVTKLVTLAKEQVTAANTLQQQLERSLPALAASVTAADQKPVVAFYEGIAAVKSVIMEMLYCHSRQVYSIVPKDNFFWQVGGQFVEQFMQERLRHDITTRNLWEVPIAKTIFSKYYQGRADVRILPSVMQQAFDSTIFLYDNKTLYVSSKKQSYCVLITSQEHTDTMRALFEGLWVGSTPHPQ